MWQDEINKARTTQTKENPMVSFTDDEQFILTDEFDNETLSLMAELGI